MYENTEYMKFARRIQEYMLRNGRNGLAPEKVGEVVLEALTTPKPRVRYAVVRPTFINRFILLIQPKRLIDGFIARNLGFK